MRWVLYQLDPYHGQKPILAEQKNGGWRYLELLFGGHDAYAYSSGRGKNPKTRPFLRSVHDLCRYGLKHQFRVVRGHIVLGCPTQS